MKIAVFGKPGGGKSTAQQIAEAVRLPLQQLDLIQYTRGGGKVPNEAFLARHAELLAQDRWVIDGFGTPQAFEAMLRAADRLFTSSGRRQFIIGGSRSGCSRVPLRTPLGGPRTVRYWRPRLAAIAS